MKSPRTTQIVIIAGIVLLVGFLFSQDIKGLVKPKEDAVSAMPTEAQAPGLSLLEASATAKNLISNAAAKEFTSLETAYQKASGEEKINQAKVLAQKWDDLEQAIPSALYLEEVANGQANLTNWVKAGDRFLKAFDNTQDSIAKPIMLQKANHAFGEAIAIDSTSLDAKTGMGVVIVNGAGAPMEGIAMLLDVVKKDPKNFKANMNLGMFAIKSGQFDKAITRFEDIIKNIKATPDSYFYLATAYENLGKNKEAIDAYLQSKKLAANPTLSSFIDKKVAELKK
ncbi:tetratricopeptide repeat protein [Pedobacter helvus]|uniref:Tetratricopeptide repeat protein n=1 Tax=Pedobacter helvus TaxID=2563444 RepID=A0ABW9JI61_9SPHI|nr:tetratricopeptide repeat protein [Pedobacter ureilyticus]